MPLELSHIISAFSLLIAAFALYRNVKGDTKLNKKDKHLYGLP